MPTYDYECSSGHRFEHLQSITAEPLTECITCGEPVRRLIGGGTGIIFKGSGFYVTDSKNGSRGKKAVAKDGAAKDGAAKDGDGKGTDKAKEKTSKADAKSGSDSSSSSGSASGDKPAKTAAAT
ncbi:MAG: zinc ribbon domain-containing protein [Spirochaetaceae bacterium]|nr:zinc ribbon domain-containing protein [Spirochaetaceae bacterium]